MCENCDDVTDLVYCSACDEWICLICADELHGNCWD